MVMAMKKSIMMLAVLLVLTALGVTMFVHAGDLPPVPLGSSQGSSIPEVSSEYEVPIDLDDPSTAALKLSDKTLTLNYKATKKLTASEKGVTWSSSNDKVVRVDQNGVLTATGRGTASVTATAGDGRTAACSVTVRYTILQWIIRILLFGWLWY